MTFKTTPEEIKRCERIMRNPFDGHVQYLIDPKPIARDDGLFQHGADWVPCHGCQPNPWGGEPWVHVHLLAIGDNGGVRCIPYCTVEDVLADLMSRVRLGVITDEDGIATAVGLFNMDRRDFLAVPITNDAHVILSEYPDRLDLLLQHGLLFDEDVGDER